MHQRIQINSKKGILYISETKIEEGMATSSHSHNNLEIILVTSKGGSLKTSKDTIKICEQDLIIINPYFKHCELKDGLSFYAIGIRDINIFDSDSFKDHIIVSSLSAKEYSSFLSMFKTIFANAMTNDSYSEDIIDAYYDIIINSLKRKFVVSNSQRQEPDVVTNIKDIIDNYYATNFSLEDISKRLNMSVSSICHIFKKETGESIVNYRINKQLEEAKNLLEISDMSISEISSFVGFGSPSYFISKYKEKYQITPKEYRNIL